MSTRITIDCTYDAPLTDLQRQELIDRFYAAVIQRDYRVVMFPGVNLFDVEIDAQPIDE